MRSRNVTKLVAKLTTIGGLRARSFGVQIRHISPSGCKPTQKEYTENGTNRDSHFQLFPISYERNQSFMDAFAHPGGRMRRDSGGMRLLETGLREMVLVCSALHG